MGRSGYVDDYDGDDRLLFLAERSLQNALKGKRGQAFLREMLEALEVLPQKRLIAQELEQGGEVCAIGCVGLKRGVDMDVLDPEDAHAIAKAFGVAPMLVREIESVNDDDFSYRDQTPEQRYERVLKWVREQLGERPHQ